MRVLRFHAPMYAMCAILAFSIVIYVLFGAPDIKLSLPDDWDSLVANQLEDNCCYVCCGATIPDDNHKNILKIMEQACQPPTAPPVPYTIHQDLESSPERHLGGTTEYHPYMDVDPYRTLDSIGQLSDPYRTLDSTGQISAGILRSSHSPTPESRVQFADQQQPPPYLGDTYSDALDNVLISDTDDSAIRPRLKIMVTSDTDEEADWPPPPTFQPISVENSPLLTSRPSPRLQRSIAIDDEDDDEDDVNDDDQHWMVSESQI